MKFKLIICLFMLALTFAFLFSCGECTHEFSEWETIKEATCTEKGNKISRCSLCEISKNEEIEKTEHTEIILERIEATCSSTGKTNGVKCNVCNKTLVNQEEIPMTEHTPSIIKGASPTCDNAGFTDGIKCEKCNKTILAQDNLPKTGHDFTNGSCSNCGVAFFTESLQYTLIDENSSYKVSLGDCLDEAIVIPCEYKGLPVTLIEATAFNDGKFKEIVIPNSILTIEMGAFKGCSNLEKITIPFVGKSADASGKEALFGYIFGNTKFDGAYKVSQAYSYLIDDLLITSYYIPNSLTSVTLAGNKLPFGAFHRCKSINSISISEYIKEYPNYCFGETSISYLHISKNVQNIRSYAFSKCNSLSEFIVDESNAVYKSVNGNILSKDTTAFLHYALGKTEKSFTFSENITEIGEAAFSYCTNLEYIYLGNSIEIISDSAFLGCKSLKELTLPDSLKIIDNNAFLNCTNLTQIIFSNSIEIIGDFAFQNCSSLSTLEIPSSVRVIKSYAFSCCSNLTTIFLPSATEEIGKNAFWQNSKATIYCESSNANENWHDDWNTSNCTVVWNYEKE